jgi:cell division protein FtsN
MQWMVNLVAFKQEWYAQRKAAEFDKKGIPAKVIQVEVNGQTWFRLTVKGFKSKSEAAAYAVKVKKILNLSSTWITKV